LINAASADRVPLLDASKQVAQSQNVRKAAKLLAIE
jgi:hypothetical protein